MALGHSDIAGNDKHGRGVYIECKAPGKRATLKAHQREFLEKRISLGCFAACADSAEYVSELYHKFQQVGLTEQKRLLLESLPKSRKDDEGELF